MRTCYGSCRVNVSFSVPCARLSPDLWRNISWNISVTQWRLTYLTCLKSVNVWGVSEGSVRHCRTVRLLLMLWMNKGWSVYKVFHFWCPVPVSVRTNTQTYYETYRDSWNCRWRRFGSMRVQQAWCTSDRALTLRFITSPQTWKTWIALCQKKSGLDPVLPMAMLTERQEHK